MQKNKEKILVAMSGGVDSSVAAALLKDAGHEVVGISMHLYSCNNPSAKSCCSASDRLDAAQVCEKLGIPFFSADYRSHFKEKVIKPFIWEYLNGRTPSPCILCNRHLKFGVLFEEMERVGASFVATGHYANITKKDDGTLALQSGADARKDQSYFLFNLSQKDLARTTFPLGGSLKSDVRKIAARYGLPTQAKSESQEICFIPDGDYVSFVESAAPHEIKGPGNFVDVRGRILGRHKGIHAYTVGQRRGLGFGAGARQYVVKIDVQKNEVVLGSKNDLSRCGMLVRNVHWTNPKAARPSAVKVKIRSTHRAVDAAIEEVDADSVRVVFDEPEAGVAPGQAAVFYDGSEVLGGGWIE